MPAAALFSGAGWHYLPSPKLQHPWQGRVESAELRFVSRSTAANGWIVFFPIFFFPFFTPVATDYCVSILSFSLSLSLGSARIQRSCNSLHLPAAPVAPPPVRCRAAIDMDVV